MSTDFLEAHADVERERWMREEGRCPDCGQDLGVRDHPDDACGEPPVEPAACDVCGRAIPVMSDLPLCRGCMATAKAHGRLEAERRRQVGEGMGQQD